MLKLLSLATLVFVSGCTTIQVNGKDCTTYRDGAKGVTILICPEKQPHILPVRER